jgi:hypothetical protein
MGKSWIMLIPVFLHHSVKRFKSGISPMPIEFLEYRENSGVKTPARRFMPIFFHCFADFELKNSLYVSSVNCGILSPVLMP